MNNFQQALKKWSKTEETYKLRIQRQLNSINRLLAINSGLSQFVQSVANMNLDGDLFEPVPALTELKDLAQKCLAYADKVNDKATEEDLKLKEQEDACDQPG